jgi:Baseplate J-like protein
MNTDTVTLIERPYQEIVDDILTAIVGGVVREPIFFDVKEDHYPLAQRADAQRNIRSITGTARPPGAPKSVHYTFKNGVDYTYSVGDNSVAWLTGGQKPDDDTTFYVDYFPVGSSSPLTDINIGSVTRTLSEAIGREVATVYQQINLAYLSGFVDTATGKSLELVVSILGITRLTKEFATGLVTFFRNQAAGNGSITISEQTLLSTAKGEATFITTELRTLQQGQVRIDVPVRATEASKGPAGVVPANSITSLAQAITGIDHVTNFDPTILGSADETDDQLRARAKAVLRGLGKATLASLIQIVKEERATLIEIWDPNSPAPKNAPFGQVILQIQAEPERFLSIQSAVEETRAAGVRATVVAKYVYFTPRMVLTIASRLTPAGKVKLVGQVIDAIQKYVDTLGVGVPAKGEDLVKAITSGSIEEVNDEGQIKIVDVVVTRFDASPPVVETFATQLANAVLGVISSTPSNDPTTLTKVLIDTITKIELLPPGGERIPDRSLLQDASGQPATDAEIEASQFQVSATVNGDNQWQVVLDMDPTDISLLEKS